MNNSPFYMIHETLLRDIAADSVLSGIRKRNVIRWDSANDPAKGETLDSDFPELMLYMTNVTGNLHASSSHSSFITNWRFQVTTNTYKAAEVFELLWAVIRTLSRWKTLPPTWKDRPFIRDVQFSRGDQGLSQPQNTKNITGWATIIDAQITITVLTSDLRENN
jgi:hypothetical protein